MNPWILAALAAAVAVVVVVLICVFWKKKDDEPAPTPKVVDLEAGQPLRRDLNSEPEPEDHSALNAKTMATIREVYIRLLTDPLTGASCGSTFDQVTTDFCPTADDALLQAQTQLRNALTGYYMHELDDVPPQFVEAAIKQRLLMAVRGAKPVPKDWSVAETDDAVVVTCRPPNNTNWTLEWAQPFAALLRNPSLTQTTRVVGVFRGDRGGQTLGMHKIPTRTWMDLAGPVADALRARVDGLREVLSTSEDAYEKSLNEIVEFVTAV